MMSGEVRSITVLLQVVYVDETSPLVSHDHRIVSALEDGRISSTEAGVLQRFAALSSRGQKRALADSVDVTPEGVAAMRERLAAVRRRLPKAHSHRDEARDV